MRVHTDYLWFNTKHRQEFVRITDDIAEIVAKSGVREGMVLVSAMHITAGVHQRLRTGSSPISMPGWRSSRPRACRTSITGPARTTATRT
jgi:hypothetical protein